MKILLAILLGGAFGFVLQRAGATNATNIINMLTLRDFKIARLLLLAIGLSSVAVFLLNAVNPELVRFSVKGAYPGVAIGGIIFGIGFGLAGYCPGTSVCALGEGKIDALVFVIGGLAGALGFTLLYASIKSSFLFDAVAGGKATLAATGSEKYTPVVQGIPGSVVAVGIAVLLFAALLFLPKSAAR